MTASPPAIPEAVWLAIWNRDSRRHS